MNHTIKLGNEEADIDLVLPGGQVIQLQYRLESPSIDVCLPDECDVTNWQGDNMEPACQSVCMNSNGEFSDEPHVRQAKQLVIDLDSKWIDCF